MKSISKSPVDAMLIAGSPRVVNGRQEFSTTSTQRSSADESSYGFIMAGGLGDSVGGLRYVVEGTRGNNCVARRDAGVGWSPGRYFAVALRWELALFCQNGSAGI